MFDQYTSLEKRLMFPILAIVWVVVKISYKINMGTNSNNTQITPKSEEKQQESTIELVKTDTTELNNIVTTFRVARKTESTSYYFRVLAVNSFGPGVMPGGSSTTTISSPPATVNLIVTTIVSDGTTATVTHTYTPSTLNKRIALIGGLFSAPLALVFPPILHLYAGVDNSRVSQILDVGLALF